MTFAEYYAQYRQLYLRKAAEKTLESYDRIYALIAPALSGLELDAITPDDVQLALILVEDRAGSRQAQIAYAHLHAVFRRALRSRRLQYNPADAIDRPEHHAKAGRVLEEDDFRALQDVFDADPAFALMIYAGLRRGEVLGLRWGDIDLDAGLIRIRRQRLRVKRSIVIAPPKSAAGVRDVPIDAILRPILLRLPLMHPNTLICPCSPETLARRWKRAQEDAGVLLPYRLHDLRHTYATGKIIEGCNPRILQYIIGHASLDLTVKTYTHIGSRQAKREIDRLSLALH